MGRAFALLVLFSLPAAATLHPTRSRIQEPIRPTTPTAVTGVRGYLVLLPDEVTRGEGAETPAAPAVRIAFDGARPEPVFYFPAETRATVAFDDFSIALEPLPGFERRHSLEERVVADSIAARDLSGALSALNRALFTADSGVSDGAPELVMTIALRSLAETPDRRAAFQSAADALAALIPSDTSGRILVALHRSAFLEGLERYDEAASAYRAAIASGADAMPGAWKKLGLLAAFADDSATSLAALRAAVESDTMDAEAWILLGAQQIAAGETTAAKASIARALASGNRAAEAHYLRARLQALTGGYDLARYEIDAAIKATVMENYPEWYTNMLERYRDRLLNR